MLVVEVGYLVDVLFHVVDERRRSRRSMVFASKLLEGWGRGLHDPDPVEAILDRILECRRFVMLEGSSMRTRHLDPVPGLSN